MTEDELKLITELEKFGWELTEPRVMRRKWYGKKGAPQLPDLPYYDNGKLYKWRLNND
jgi:hypothetical protein